MRVCLMVEGQEGVEWEHWLSLAEAAERLRFVVRVRRVGKDVGDMDRPTLREGAAGDGSLHDRNQASDWSGNLAVMGGHREVVAV